MAMMAAFLDMISEAWWELKRARLRSYLAITGIVVGSTGMYILISAYNLESADKTPDKSGLITVRMPDAAPPDPFRTERIRLKRQHLIPPDAAAIAQAYPGIQKVIIEGGQMVYLKARNRNSLTAVSSTNSTDAASLGGEQLGLVWGRFLTAQDIADAARVIVLDHLTRKALFGLTAFGGGEVRIDGVKFRVIGVQSPLSTLASIMPYTTMQDLYLQTEWHFTVVPRPGVEPAELARTIDRVLKGRIGDPGASFVGVPRIDPAKRKLYLLGGLVGILVLLAAGIGLSNKTYIDALERTPHFAMRRALGASVARLYGTVILESVILCAMGCALGNLLGFMLFETFAVTMKVFLQARGVAVSFPWQQLAMMMSFILIIGLLGGVQGAAVAAKVNPAEVLNRKDLV